MNLQSEFVYCIINHRQTLNFALCKRDGITDRQTYGKTDKRTDGRTDKRSDGRTDTRCPRRTFHYIGVLNTAIATINIL